MTDLYHVKSIKDFMTYFNSDDKCLAYLIDLKFGITGWKCEICNYKEYTYLPSHNAVVCKRCGREESIISNTIMRKTRKSLSEWFWTIYTISTQKTGISAMELYRQADFGSYQTAWSWLQKLRLGMASDKQEQLKGTVEVDETYLYSGEKQGRSLIGNKALIVAAVERYKDYASGRVSLRHIGSASKENLQSFIKDHVAKGSTIKTDGWAGYKGIDKLGYAHVPVQADTPENVSKELPRVHQVFSNLKAWLIGTHRFVSKKHLQNYLNEFTLRFDNRRHPIEVFNDILKRMMFIRPRAYKDFIQPRKPKYPNPYYSKERHRNGERGHALLKVLGIVAGVGVTGLLVYAIAKPYICPVCKKPIAKQQTPCPHCNTNLTWSTGWHQ